MADDQNVNFNDQVQKAEEFKNVFAEIRDYVREWNKDLKDAGEMTANVSGTFSSIASSASKVSQLQGEIAESAEGTKKASAERNKLEAKIKQLQAQQKIFAESNSTLAQEQAKNLGDAVAEAEQLLGVYSDIVDEGKELDKKTKFFTGLQTFVSSIPGLKALSGPFEKASKAAREAAAHGGTTGDAFKAGGKSLLDSFKEISIIGLIIQGIVMAIKEGLKFDEQVTALQNGLALSTDEAKNLRNNLSAANDNTENLLITTEKRIQTLLTLNQQFGSSSRNISQQLIDQAITLKDKIGLSGEAIGELTKLFTLTKEESGKNVESLIGASYELQAQNGIALDNKKVLAEIAGVSGAMRANFIGNNEALAKTVTTAQMLGLNLKSIEGIQGNLMDFESSISNELEAELLTGKELNLERARAAALNNDYATVAKEITSQVGSLADFQNMNYLAQEAIAKAVGMTRNELADTLVQQQVLTNLGLTEKATMQERLAAAEKLKAEGKDLNQVLGEGVYEQMQQLSLNEQFEGVMNRIKDLVTDLVGGPIFEWLQSTVKNKDFIEDVRKSLEKWGGIVQGIIGNFNKLKYVLVAILAYKTAIAAASITAAVAGTGGAAAAWLPAAIATTVGIGTGLIGSYLVSDGAVDSHDGPVIKRNKDELRLYKDDQMLIGTNLFGESNNQGGSSGIDYDKLAAAMERRPMTINVSGQRFGEIANKTTGGYTYSLES